MLAVVERARLGGAVLLLAAGATLFTIEVIEERSSCPPPTHGYQCMPPQSLAAAARNADVFYRHGQFELAECQLRIAADREDPDKREELHLVAEFYHQLGHSFPIALDRRAPDSLEHLEWAIQFDAMLGGAYQEQLLGERADRYVMIRK